jgi:hypothetical protein
LCSVIGCTPKSAATCSIVTPSSRLRATRTTSSRNSRGRAWAHRHPSSPPSLGKPTQMSPNRAPVPWAYSGRMSGLVRAADPRNRSGCIGAVALAVNVVCRGRRYRTPPQCTPGCVAVVTGKSGARILRLN